MTIGNIFNLNFLQTDVVAEIRESSRTIEGKTDIQIIIENIESNYQRLEKCSRFVVLVKTRAAATALTMRLPGYLRSTYLTGLQESLEEGGMTNYNIKSGRLILQQTSLFFTSLFQILFFKCQFKQADFKKKRLHIEHF